MLTVPLVLGMFSHWLLHWPLWRQCVVCSKNEPSYPMSTRTNLASTNCSPDNKHNAEKSKIVGNKAKGRISKRVLQENKAWQIFRKTNISNVSGGKKYSFFRKFGVLCFLVTRFEIHPFALSSTEFWMAIFQNRGLTFVQFFFWFNLF